MIFSSVYLVKQMKLLIYVDFVCLTILKRESCLYFPLLCKHSKNLYTNLVIIAVTIRKIPGIRLGIRSSGLDMYGSVCSENLEENEALLAFPYCVT